MKEPNIDKFEKNKKILGVSIGLGGNALRLAIVLEILFFPFFCFWFYNHSINIFQTLTVFEYFLFASCAPPGAVVMLNWSSRFFKTGDKDLKYYDPRFYLLLPSFMDLYEHYHKIHVSFTEIFYFMGNIKFWKEVIICDIEWVILMSPLLLLAWNCRKTAKNILKNTINEDNKNELHEIIIKNS